MEGYLSSSSQKRRNVRCGSAMRGVSGVVGGWRAESQKRSKALAHHQDGGGRIMAAGDIYGRPEQQWDAVTFEDEVPVDEKWN